MRERNNTPTEHVEQTILFKWASFVSADNVVCIDEKIPKILINGQQMSIIDFLYAVPNGGKRSIKTAADLKAEGVKAGVPDISLPYPTRKHHGLFIEMKRKQGGRVSDEQKIWLEYLNKVGYLAVVCKGYEQARELIEKYLKEEI